MNRKFLPYGLSLLLIGFIALSLAGCASTGSHGTKKMLDEAGFITLAPSNPKQHEIYAAMPTYQLEEISYNGKTLYAYKDQGDGIAYVGDVVNYHQYQKIAMQQQINQQQAQAIAMDHNMAMGWYGAYGPYVGGIHHYGRYR